MIQALWSVKYTKYVDLRSEMNIGSRRNRSKLLQQDKRRLICACEVFDVLVEAHICKDMPGFITNEILGAHTVPFVFLYEVLLK